MILFPAVVKLYARLKGIIILMWGKAAHVESVLAPKKSQAPSHFALLGMIIIFQVII